MQMTVVPDSAQAMVISMVFTLYNGKNIDVAYVYRQGSKMLLLMPLHSSKSQNF